MRICPFYEHTAIIIGTQAASSPATLLERSCATSPETLDLSFCEHCETSIHINMVYLMQIIP